MNTKDLVAEAYTRLGGNASAVSRELGIARSTVRDNVNKLGLAEKPITAGRIKAQETEQREVPSRGVHRYLLTAAQNNTKVHEKAWVSLMALKKYYNAELLVGTFSYNIHAYGKLAVKRGHAPGQEENLWYDQRLLPYIEAGDDRNVELAPGLLWCGRANISPTAVKPLSGFETYGGRLSCIFPHTKVAMVSIASVKSDATKFNYTTGTITQQNYIQKKAGLKAEQHHSYGALLVEVDEEGRWWCRQVITDERGCMYDLNVLADGDTVTTDNSVEGIVWGDIHEAKLDPIVRELAWADGGMLDILRPRYQFMHDLIDFQARRYHDRKDPHRIFELYVENQDNVEAEMAGAANFLKFANRKWCQMVVVDSNHDNDFLRWLRETDYRLDPANAEYFLEAQMEIYRSIRQREDFHAVEWAVRRAGCPTKVRFLRQDESFVICKKINGGIEHGMHGHLGTNGSRSSPVGLARLGRPANTAHTHSCFIIDDLYVAGLSGLLKQGYNNGPSSWSQSHTVSYKNARRAIITMWDGKWKA